MKRWGEAEDPRRRWLIQALAAGAFSGGALEALAQVLGSAPAKLPAGRSVYRVNGQEMRGRKGSLYVLEWVPYGRVRKFTHTPA